MRNNTDAVSVHCEVIKVELRSSSSKRLRYQGLDRRAAAPMVESLNLAPAMALLSALFITTLVLPVLSPPVGTVLEHTLAAAGCLAVFACVAMLMQWRIDGRAQVWWLAVGYAVVGIPALLQAGPVTDISVHLASLVVAFALFCAAWRAPEVDSALSMPRAAAALAAGLGALLLLDRVLELAAVAAITGGAATIAFASLAILWHRSEEARASFVIPLTGFAMCCGIAAVADWVPSRGAALGSVEFAVNAVAALSALAGLQGAATSERARALDARRERDLLTARQRDLESRFADTMSEVRSAASALEGGIRVRPPQPSETSDDDPLVRSLVAEVHRLGAMAAAEARVHSEFRLADALEAPLALWRANGWPVESHIDETVMVRGRPSEVTQIVHGLLSNARKYAPGTAVEVATMLTAKFILVLVDDGGPGVRPAHRERIFERGERPAHPESTEGQGLGLHIGRQIARALGGELWVEQNPRGGARFVLALQRASDGETTKPAGIREAAL